MVKLTAAKRKRIPTSKFAGPDRSYPINDRGHAANAKARASQAVKAGRMSPATEKRIDAKANRVLGKGHHSGGHAEGTKHMAERHESHRAREHERAGMKREMHRKKEGREHERAGMKKAMHKKATHHRAEHKEHGEKHVHVHHHVHHH
jgi:hypothetical protein